MWQKVGGKTWACLGLKKGFGKNMKQESRSFLQQTHWCAWAVFLGGAGIAGLAWSQTSEPPATPTAESGLEEAVKWKWKVEASDPLLWGIPGFEPSSAAAEGGALAVTGTSQAGQARAASAQKVYPTSPPDNPVEHEVTRGQALVLIAREYGVTVEQIKKANDLQTDLIRVGQKLHIPSKAEVLAMEPPPPPKTEPADGGKDPAKAAAKPPVEEVRAAYVAPKYSRPLNGAAQQASHIVLTQSYLDRQGFSVGPIDGAEGAMYRTALESYRKAYPEVLDYSGGQTPLALRAMGGAYREYVLRLEDFRWIRPVPEVWMRVGNSKSKVLRTPDPTWSGLSQETFLAYRSAWEFVAEKFHCSESLLRRINGGIKGTPKAGTLFLVPNVEPFELEKLFDEPLRPQAVPEKPVVAKILGGTWLEIWEGEKLLAKVPVSAARPGLRGRGTWKILDAVPRPRLVCLGEWANPPKATGIGLSSEEVVLRPPPAGVALAAGPNNPVGPLWLNLMRASDKEPLPYGLHGTSIPGYLTRQESLGGFRLTNWDLARVVRLLPEGTELKWE